MRSLNLAILPALPALLALAACGGQTSDRGDDAREAEGEVLGGTISDEMLPLDRLQSQSPVLRQSPGGSVDAGDGDEGEEGAESEGGEASTTSPDPASEAPPAGE